MSLQMWHDEQVLVVRDKYPKARFHILVIARDRVLQDISCVRRQHIPLLQHMRTVAQQQVDQLGAVGQVCP